MRVTSPNQSPERTAVGGASRRCPAGAGFLRQASWHMHRVLIITAFWLALVLSAFGLSMETPVTPTSLNQGTYLFSVTNSVIGDGLSFHITIKGMHGDIPNDSSVGLCIA